MNWNVEFEDLQSGLKGDQQVCKGQRLEGSRVNEGSIGKCQLQNGERGGKQLRHRHESLDNGVKNLPERTKSKSLSREE